VQTAQSFKVIREILTCWFLVKKVVAISNRLFFYILIIFVGERRITTTNVAHFLIKHCLVAFSVRNLIVLPNLAEDCFKL